ncbi:hypothetical protein SDC9_196719 [bioreactor metagenome]|uniref:Uncharacterized protein n=1 Tax=bioreactor metagenome TaxID=1076179 RepID=A0A645IDV9_9ZZZZ
MLSASAVPRGIAQYADHLGCAQRLLAAAHIERAAAVFIIYGLRQGENQPGLIVNNQVFDAVVGDRSIIVEGDSGQLLQGLFHTGYALRSIQLIQPNLACSHIHYRIARYGQGPHTRTDGIGADRYKFLSLVLVQRHDQQITYILFGETDSRSR